MSIPIRYWSCLLLMVGLLLGASAAEPSEPIVQEQRAPKATILQRFDQGGVTMWVLLGLSVAALTFTLERAVNFRRKQVLPDGLEDTARAHWEQGDFAKLEHLDHTHPSVLAGAIAVAARHRHLPASEVAQLAADDVGRVMRTHLQRAYPLAVVATLAPLLGLFGTVTGMIDSFEVVAIAGSLGDASLLAGGISKALVTTAFGLAVSIPALGAYHWCRQRTTRLALEVEGRLGSLLSRWFHTAPIPTTN